METRLIAKIKAPKKNRQCSIGTGYPISDSLLITARHVVLFEDRDCTQPIKIEWPDIKFENNESYTVTVSNDDIVYDGKKKVDLALIRCRIPEHPPVSPLILSTIFPKAHDQWASYGFARIGKDQASNTREKISLLGTFHPPNSSNHKIQLKNESDALEKAGWCGVSGAPVFQGAFLYAVITETPLKRKECLTAISIPYLLNHDNKFREIVGLENPETNFNPAKQYLQNHSGLKTELFSLIKKRTDDVADSPEALVSYLATIPIPELISIIKQAQDEHSSQVLKQELANFLRLLLPGLYGCDCVTRIRSARDNQTIPIIEIPYATDISAELLMASADDRAAEFKVIEIEYAQQLSPGKYKLALPPEAGPDNGEQLITDVEDDLMNRLGIGDAQISDMKIQVDEYLFNRYPRKQQRSYDPKDQKKLVKSWLDDNVTAKRPRFYWLMNFTGNNEQDERVRTLAQLIKKDYPQITLLSLQIDTDLEINENRLFNELVDVQTNQS